jgi:hypothetical protein
MEMMILVQEKTSRIFSQKPHEIHLEKLQNLNLICWHLATLGCDDDQKKKYGYGWQQKPTYQYIEPKVRQKISTHYLMVSSFGFDELLLLDLREG